MVVKKKELFKRYGHSAMLTKSTAMQAEVVLFGGCGVSQNLLADTILLKLGKLER